MGFETRAEESMKAATGFHESKNGKVFCKSLFCVNSRFLLKVA